MDRVTNLSNKRLFLPRLLIPVFILACALTNYTLPGQEKEFVPDNESIGATAMLPNPTILLTPAITAEVENGQEAVREDYPMRIDVASGCLFGMRM